MAVGWNSRARASASAPPMATSTLNPLSWDKIDQHAGIVRIVFNNQQDRIVGLQIGAVVRDPLNRQNSAATGDSCRGSGPFSLRRRTAGVDGPT